MEDNTEDLTAAYMLGKYDGRKEAQSANSRCSDSAGSVVRELKYLLRKIGNPPRGCVCSAHIEGQDANRAEVRKLLRERIQFHSQNDG